VERELPHNLIDDDNNFDIGDDYEEINFEHFGLAPEDVYTGNGLYSTVSNYLMSPTILQRSIQAFNVLMYGRHKFTPSSQKVLEKYGNLPITEMEISRHPITNVINTANFLTGNELQDIIDKSEYDTLFHLGLFVKVGNTWIEVEKESTVVITANKPRNKNAEIMVISPSDIPKGLTLNIMLAKAQAHLGNNFFNYSAKNANCQDFVRGVLWANDIRQEPYRKFVMQDVQGIFNASKHPELYRKITNTLTDLGHIAHTFYEGGKIY
jgi:hypothetical protein